MNRVSASIAHASRSTASRTTTSRLTASRLTTSRLTAFRSIASRSIASRTTAFRLNSSRSTTSNYSSNLGRSWLPSVSPNTLNYGFKAHLWVHSIWASNCIPKLAQSWPRSASLSWLDFSVSKCISKLARSQPPSTSSRSDSGYSGT